VKRLIGTILTMFLAMVFIASCSSTLLHSSSSGQIPFLSAAPSPAGQEENEEEEVGEGGVTFVMTIPAEPTVVDPQSKPTPGLDVLLPYLFDTLVVRDPNNQIVPSLAESWQVDPDGKAITMKLKTGVSFQDGSQLNAQAVQFTLERFKQSGTASPIYNSIEKITSIQALDDSTVRLAFDEPTADLWSAIASPYAGIISPASAELAAKSGSGHVVGSGPFMPASTPPDEPLTIIRQVGYHWGPGITKNLDATFIAAVAFKVISDPEAQIAALKAGQVDAIFVNRPDQWQQLQKEPDVQLIEETRGTMTYRLAMRKEISGMKIGYGGNMLLNDVKIAGEEGE
jgi:peptide/nickel transport system substrate-binding protein